MPRQIIDTESSRPAYIRRRVLQAVLAGLLLVVLVILAVLALHHRVPAQVGQGNWLRGGGTTLVTLCRSIDAA